MRAVTVATINKSPERNPEGRLQSYDDMGLIIDCPGRKAQITGYAAWDENENPMVIYGGMPEALAITPNSVPELGYKLMCERKGVKANQYLFQVLQRWRSTGRPL